MKRSVGRVGTDSGHAKQERRRSNSFTFESTFNQNLEVSERGMQRVTSANVYSDSDPEFYTAQHREAGTRWMIWS